MIQFIDESGMKISGDWRYWLISSTQAGGTILSAFFLIAAAHVRIGFIHKNMLR
ncbi:hypothetical protein [Pedobacter sp. SYSU D00535]|uniref:hypothetical protein n=1 Tax=Pedobacter sp. SYSU D00535 TaxID=2810308 RepID=UPI001A95B446|nr:hypothetical protein [Pedobacter sp. SYSU D00535]